MSYYGDFPKEKIPVQNQNSYLWVGAGGRDPILGTPAYYRLIDQYAVDESASCNSPTVLPRVRNASKDKDIELSKLTGKKLTGKKLTGKELTGKELTCHYLRHDSGYDLNSNDFVSVELNPEYTSNGECKYQFSRVQVASDGHIFENTRQYMCLYCQRHKYFSVAGKHSLFYHWRFSHPQEVPPFLLILLNKLNLYTDVEPITGQYWYVAPTLGKKVLWPNYVYPQGGVANQTRFTFPSKSMKLSEVDFLTDFLTATCWYRRDIKSYTKLGHRDVKYLLNPCFDELSPEVAQICRAATGQKGLLLKRNLCFLCLYCQQPRFFPLNGPNGLLSHLAYFHWPIQMPEVQKCVEALDSTCEEFLAREKEG